MPFAALALATALASGASPILEPRSITCVIDQIDSSDRLNMGKALAVDIAWPSPTSDPDKRTVQKYIIVKMSSCPGVDAMGDKQLALAESYTESRLLHDYVDHMLGGTREGGSMIDAVLGQISDADQRNLAKDFGGAPDQDPTPGHIQAAAAVKRAINRFDAAHQLSPEESAMLVMGVTAKLGMAVADGAWQTQAKL